MQLWPSLSPLLSASLRQGLQMSPCQSVVLTENVAFPLQHLKTNFATYYSQLCFTVWHRMHIHISISLRFTRYKIWLWVEPKPQRNKSSYCKNNWQEVVWPPFFVPNLLPVKSSQAYFVVCLSLFLKTVPITLNEPQLLGQLHTYCNTEEKNLTKQGFSLLINLFIIFSIN